MSEWQILKFEADLDIVKVYEYSIPTRLGVCEQREIRATLEILEYDCAQALTWKIYLGICKI